VILIYTNQPDGVSLEPKDGCYEITIPSNGILKVRGPGPFYQWHTLSASFANGGPLPVANDPDAIGETTVALWPGGSGQGGLVYDFVGTPARHRVFSKEESPDRLRPGRVSD
jgi:hypothetical protein